VTGILVRVGGPGDAKKSLPNDWPLPGEVLPATPQAQFHRRNREEWNASNCHCRSGTYRLTGHSPRSQARNVQRPAVSPREHTQAAEQHSVVCSIS